MFVAYTQIVNKICVVRSRVPVSFSVAHYFCCETQWPFCRDVNIIRLRFCNICADAPHVECKMNVRVIGNGNTHEKPGVNESHVVAALGEVRHELLRYRDHTIDLWMPRIGDDNNTRGMWALVRFPRGMH